VRWLGFEWENRLWASDYFDEMYECALTLIKDGKAYVCDLNADQIREYRGTLKEPGKESPYRNRTVEENLALFERMKNGEFADGACTLRAKIDMASPNMNLRDPAIYRILHVSHHRQGDKWCIYPLYDFAHPIQDALEGITHSMCSIEFENHRPLYDWVVNSIGFEKKPHQYEFARLNVTNTVMSKRYLRRLVETNVVDGWDDPRMPTLCGLRRRGYTPESIFEFVKKAGVAKNFSIVDIALLESCIRDELNANALRRIVITDPVKVVIENYPDDKKEYFETSNNPNDPEAGKRELLFTKELFIDRNDFSLDPPPKYFRLKPDGEVRLMGAYIIKFKEVKTDENGNVTEIICTADLETRNGNPVDGRKVKGTIHWLSTENCIDCEVAEFGKLFTIENTGAIPEGQTFDDYLNVDSVKILKNCKAEKCLETAAAGDRFQFVRTGYFCKDSKYEGRFNRIVELKDSKPTDKK
jgi:glutaminyl-tRNA synthetase